MDKIYNMLTHSVTYLGNSLCPANNNALPLNAVTCLNCRMNYLLADFSY